MLGAVILLFGASLYVAALVWFATEPNRRNQVLWPTMEPIWLAKEADDAQR